MTFSLNQLSTAHKIIAASVLSLGIIAGTSYGVAVYKDRQAAVVKAEQDRKILNLTKDATKSTARADVYATETADLKKQLTKVKADYQVAKLKLRQYETPRTPLKPPPAEEIPVPKEAQVVSEAVAAVLPSIPDLPKGRTDAEIEDLKTALAICETQGLVADAVIDSQGKEIGALRQTVVSLSNLDTVRQDREAELNKELNTQIKRKQWWRTGFYVAAAKVVLDLLTKR